MYSLFYVPVFHSWSYVPLYNLNNVDFTLEYTCLPCLYLPWFSTGTSCFFLVPTCFPYLDLPHFYSWLWMDIFPERIWMHTWISLHTMPGCMWIQHWYLPEFHSWIYLHAIVKYAWISHLCPVGFHKLPGFIPGYTQIPYLDFHV